MTIRHRRLAVQDSSGDSSDEYEMRGRLPRDSFRRRSYTFATDVIMIDDSDMSNSDIDIISVEGVECRKRPNDVWRKILECDLLDERIKCIGLESVMIHRDTESYELPSYKVCNFRRNYCGQWSRLKERLGSRRSQALKNKQQRRRRSRSRSRQLCKNQTICLSTSEDEVEIIDVEQPKKVICKDEKKIILNLLDSDTDSSSEDDEQGKEKFSSWLKLMEHLHNNRFNMEFEDGRRRAALTIARELQETKIDLIDRCLIYLGVEKCLVFLEATKKVELCGGMPTKDGSRRRTPGGVFLTMIKSDRTIEDVVKEQIFMDSDNICEQNDSLWWRSLEIFQYKRSAPLRGVENYARKKEFRSYTLLDLDYFEGIREFRYRYIPIMTNFPLQNVKRNLMKMPRPKDCDSDVCMITEIDSPHVDLTLDSEKCDV